MKRRGFVGALVGAATSLFALPNRLGETLASRAGPQGPAPDASLREEVPMEIEVFEVEGGWGAASIPEGGYEARAYRSDGRGGWTRID